jgi:dCMP deaminase
MTQQEKDKYYMKVAQVTSENSKALRLKVGAVLVKDDQIISDGFNGMPSGFDNTCEKFICLDKAKCLDSSTCSICLSKSLKTNPEVLHAESNAITKCAKYGYASLGSTLYVTHSPCIECAKLIIQAGIKRVVYRELYRKPDGLNLLNKANINVIKYEGNSNK